MKRWTRVQGSVPILMCLGLLLTGAEAFAANDEQCLSLGEVHGGYPRYHIVGGRRCWYASTRGPAPRAPETKRPERRPSTASPEEVNVNPYDDPIWREPDASSASASTPASRAKNCEEQALKLDLKEKHAFMKQCMAN